MWCNLYFRYIFIIKLNMLSKENKKPRQQLNMQTFKSKSKFGKCPWARTAWRRRTRLQQLLPRLLRVYFCLCFNVVFFFYCLFLLMSFLYEVTISSVSARCVWIAIWRTVPCFLYMQKYTMEITIKWTEGFSNVLHRHWFLTFITMNFPVSICNSSQFLLHPYIFSA